MKISLIVHQCDRIAHGGRHVFVGYLGYPVRMSVGGPAIVGLHTANTNQECIIFNFVFQVVRGLKRVNNYFCDWIDFENVFF